MLGRKRRGQEEEDLGFEVGWFIKATSEEDICEAGGWESESVVDCLPSAHEAPGSLPRIFLTQRPEQKWTQMSKNHVDPCRKNSAGKSSGSETIKENSGGS